MFFVEFSLCLKKIYYHMSLLQTEEVVVTYKHEIQVKYMYLFLFIVLNKSPIEWAAFYCTILFHSSCWMMFLRSSFDKWHLWQYVIISLYCYFIWHGVCSVYNFIILKTHCNENVEGITEKELMIVFLFWCVLWMLYLKASLLSCLLVSVFCCCFFCFFCFFFILASLFI